MHGIVENKISELRELCRRFGVSRLELFGSATRDEEFRSESSDLDFLVEYLPQPEADALEEFFGFKAELESLFGRHVDLVEPGAIRNPYFREEVEETKVPVYAAQSD